jgi:hypothetical protein
MSVSLATTAKAGDWNRDATGRQFVGELNRACGPKRLDFLSPADMEYVTSNYRSSLAPSLRKKVEAGAAFDRKSGRPSACRDLDGLTCDATEYLKGIGRAGLMHRFVRRLCESYEYCLSVVNCTSSPKAKGTLMDQPEVADRAPPQTAGPEQHGRK